MAKRTVSFEFPKPIDANCLVGHTDTMRAFMDAWEKRDEHPMHPVWILSGTRGIGKATMAYQIAKMVYGNVGDFFIIDMEHNIDKDGKPKPDGKVISVYTIRAMIEKMQLSSHSGEWRVVLIDSVDELNTAASNAMLKLLEEPPEKTLFLLIVHQLANVLPTVRSRARVEKMHPLGISELRELCVKYLPEFEIGTATLGLANGSFGKIASLKLSGGDDVYSELVSVLESPNCSASDMMNVAKKIAPDPALHGILLDVILHFGLADLYPTATIALRDMNAVYLEPEIAIFKIISQIKKCL